MKNHVLHSLTAAALLAVMLMSASCGRENTPPDPAGSQHEHTSSVTTTVDTAPAESTTWVSDICVETAVRVCRVGDGQLLLMEESGMTVAVSYDAASGNICKDDGTVMLNVSSLDVGDVIRVTYNGDLKGGDPGSYGHIYEMVKTADASDESDGGTHGIICRAGDSLLVYPRPADVLDITRIDPDGCYEIPLTGIPVVDGTTGELLSAQDLKVGDFVTVLHSGARTTKTPVRFGTIFSVTRCANLTMQMTVTSIRAGEALVLGDVLLERMYFDRGEVSDTAGKAVAFEDVSVGDVFELQYSGEITASSPAQLNHIHTVRLIKTAAQVQADKEASGFLRYGIVRVFENKMKMVWFGMTSAPEEISYFSCTMLSLRGVPITDAVTGQSLTWGDLQDGDLVAVISDGRILESAPSQMPVVYAVKRLQRASTEATVSEIRGGEVTLRMDDGGSRTVTLKRFYVRGVEMEPEHLCVGDRVQLDVNAADPEEVYALHLLAREVTVPEGAVIGTYRVTQSNGMNTVLEDGIVLDHKQICFRADGTPVALRLGIVSPNRMVTVYHNGTLTGSEPARFGMVYKIVLPN